MKRSLQSPRLFSMIAASAALGAATMFIFDPNKGRRRRALFRDQARRSLKNVGRLLRVSARDLRHRTLGAGAAARHFFKRNQAADDLVLIERVRAKMGRVVSHPHAIQIGARDGRITLSGPILPQEAEPLLDAAGSVWGVKSVEDHLVIFDRPESIPSLQGGVRRTARTDLRQEQWTPVLRIAAALAGGALAICAVRQRGLTRVALGTIAVGLTARGAANVPLKRLTRLSRRAIDLQKSIHIAAPVERVYDLWADCRNFPRFMSNVIDVREIDDGRTHWIVRGPAGVPIEWDSVVTRALRPHLLSWRTEPSSTVQHAGSVHFEDEDGGTRLTVRMTYNAIGGVGHAIASLLGSDPKRQMEDDLAHMKTLIEQGMPPADAAKPEHDARPALH